MRRLAAVCVLLLVIAGLFVWYTKSRDSWYAGAYAGGHLLRIGIRNDNPPFSFLDRAGALAGFDVDIADALCVKLQVECQLVQLGPLDSPITYLIDGKFDAVVSSLPIASLLKPGSVSFTDKYYSFPAMIGCCGAEAGSYASGSSQLDAAWRFIARKGAGIEISPSGLANKRIGFQDGASYDIYLRGAFPLAVRMKFPSQAAANLAMATGGLDLLLGESRILSETFLNTDLGRSFEFTGPAVTDQQLLGTQAGIAVRSEDRKLLQAINQALAALRAEGTYKKINDRYFDFDLYGG